MDGHRPTPLSLMTPSVLPQAKVDHDAQTYLQQFQQMQQQQRLQQHLQLQRQQQQQQKQSASQSDPTLMTMFTNPFSTDNLDLYGLSDDSSFQYSSDLGADSPGSTEPIEPISPAAPAINNYTLPAGDLFVPFGKIDMTGASDGSPPAFFKTDPDASPVFTQMAFPPLSQQSPVINPSQLFYNSSSGASATAAPIDTIMTSPQLRAVEDSAVRSPSRSPRLPSDAVTMPARDPRYSVHKRTAPSAAASRAATAATKRASMSSSASSPGAGSGGAGATRAGAKRVTATRRESKRSRRQAAANAADEDEADEDASVEADADVELPVVEEAAQSERNSHNLVEKRYRNNLNDRIAELREAVPTLRAMMRRVHPQQASSSRGSADAAGAGDESADEAGVDADTEDLSGRKAGKSITKATVLKKATEYIQSLERQHEERLQEIALLRQKLALLEKGESDAQDMPNMFF